MIPLTVFTPQWANAPGAVQEIALAGTPLSTSFRLVQVTPEVFEKNSVPVPLLGDVNVKCVPTGAQLGTPQTGSFTMIFGSGTEFANAVTLATTMMAINKALVRFIIPRAPGSYSGLCSPWPPNAAGLKLAPDAAFSAQ